MPHADMADMVLPVDTNTQFLGDKRFTRKKRTTGDNGLGWLARIYPLSLQKPRAGGATWS